jgi:ABC-type Zn2+ transport system substrate-binding protein/surface adhesin
LTSFPILGRKLNSIGMTKLQNVSHHLMDMILKAESATQNIENALLNADAQKLKIYTQNLREISQKLRVNTDKNLLEKEATL